ncbi:hypothetical protein PUN28_016158 [Cardiocondyla obscurior]|uniref:Uncharacterized protein n=1 Tax=Cardiocondyla obscurior TaxID=286306 RepID=A0AAW2ER86_9HYME
MIRRNNFNHSSIRARTLDRDREVKGSVLLIFFFLFKKRRLLFHFLNTRTNHTRAIFQYNPIIGIRLK